MYQITIAFPVDKSLTPELCDALCERVKATFEEHDVKVEKGGFIRQESYDGSSTLL